MTHCYQLSVNEREEISLGLRLQYLQFDKFIYFI